MDDLMSYGSILMNIIFVWIFWQLRNKLSPRFLNETIMVIFGRIKNAELDFSIYGSRMMSWGWSSQATTKPLNKSTNQNITTIINAHKLHTEKGLQVNIMVEGFPESVDLLSKAVQSVEAEIADKAMLNVIAIEKDRNLSELQQNMFTKKHGIILGVVMILGFIALGGILLNMQTILEGAGELLETARPAIEDWIAKTPSIIKTGQDAAKPAGDFIGNIITGGTP